MILKSCLNITLYMVVNNYITLYSNITLQFFVNNCIFMKNITQRHMNFRMCPTFCSSRVMSLVPRLGRKKHEKQICLPLVSSR